MHVLQATEYFLPEVERGIERFVYELSKSLQESRIDVTVITGSNVKQSEVKVRHAAMPGAFAMSVTRGGYDRRLSFVLSSLVEMRGIPYDVAHAHHYAGGYAAYLNKKASKKPYVVTVHIVPGASMLSGPVPVYRTMFKHALKNADSVVSVSEIVREEVKKSYGIDSDVIPHCVDVRRFKPAKDKAAMKVKLGLAGEKVILMLSSLGDRRKRAEMLLRTMPLILERVPDARLMLAGGADPATLTGLNSLSIRLGVRKHVTLAGRIPEASLPVYYSAADVFVLPSLEEAAGLVLLEAMASGVPVVGSDSGGIPEYLEDGVNGYLFDPYSLEDLAEKVSSLLEDDDKAVALGKEGRRNAVERHSWAAAAKSYTAIYESAGRA